MVNRKTREIVGCDIAENMSVERVQRIVDNSPKANFYFFDTFPVYSQICGVYEVKAYSVKFENKSDSAYVVVSSTES